MYNLDFDTIKLVMREHQKTGFLYADAPSGTTSLREPCHIEIKIETGNIALCTLIGSSGQRLTGKEAEKALSRVGRLSWTFTPQQEAALPQSPSPTAPRIPSTPTRREFLPRRVVRLEQWEMRNWPRMHRAVFALTDGTKSVTKIAGMLSVPADQVERALRDLQSMGVIVL